MTGLETAFYIVGIVFMGLSLVLLVALLVAVITIRAKLHTLEDSIRHKLDIATSTLQTVVRFAPVFRIIRRILKIRRMMR